MQYLYTAAGSVAPAQPDHVLIKKIVSKYVQLSRLTTVLNNVQVPNVYLSTEMRWPYYSYCNLLHSYICLSYDSRSESSTVHTILLQNFCASVVLLLH